MSDLDRLRANLDAVQARIDAACARAGRDPGEVTLVAVSKTHPVEALRVLYEAGVRDFGESYVQEWQDKAPRLPDDVRWHFIGHLQSNKAKVVDRICELVHSVDSPKAARRLSAPMLVEVNLSGEPTKAGIPPEGLAAFLAEHPARGLMTMPPATDDPEASRPFFRRLRELAAEHGLAELSMGTSQDYRVAAEEGATLVRVGSILYRE